MPRLVGGQRTGHYSAGAQRRHQRHQVGVTSVVLDETYLRTPEISIFKVFCRIYDSLFILISSSWSPGGVYLASCSDDMTAKIWNSVTGILNYHSYKYKSRLVVQG